MTNLSSAEELKSLAAIADIVEVMAQLVYAALSY
jgi:hypothetical protein